VHPRENPGYVNEFSHPSRNPAGAHGLHLFLCVLREENLAKPWPPAVPHAMVTVGIYACFLLVAVWQQRRGIVMTHGNLLPLINASELAHGISRSAHVARLLDPSHS